MNNKPVAWWTGEYDDEGDDFMFPKTRQAHIDHPASETHKFFPIPLYTHPVKEEHFEDEPQAEELHEIMQSNTHPAELTDEEIIEIGLLTTDPRFSHIESSLLLEFARAILRKAQDERK